MTEYWCHECRNPFTFDGVGTPACPTCASEFVEEREDGMDPTTFYADVEEQPAPSAPPVSGAVQWPPPSLFAPSAASQRRTNRSSGEQQGQVYSFSFNMGGPGSGQMPHGGPRVAPPHGAAPPDFFRALFGNVPPVPSGSASSTTHTTGPGTQSQTQAGPHHHHRAPGEPGMGMGRGQQPSMGPLLRGFGSLMQHLLDPQHAQGGAGRGRGAGGPGSTGNFLADLFGLAGMDVTAGGGNFGDYAFGDLDALIARLTDSNRFGTPPTSGEVLDRLPKDKVTQEMLEHTSACAVCQDEFSVGDEAAVLPCKHFFHNECVMPWLKEHSTCPTCRYELRTDDPMWEAQKEQRNRQVHQH